MRLVARLMAALLVATLVLPALGVGSAFAAAADHLAVTVGPSAGTAGDAFEYGDRPRRTDQVGRVGRGPAGKALAGGGARAR